MRALVACGVAIASVAMASGPPGPGQRCLMQVLNVDRKAVQNDLFNNGSNVQYDAAGHVRMRCKGQTVFLNADSVSALSGDYVRMYGHVHYRDTTYVFDADTAIYIIRQEKLEARSHVIVLDRVAGSTLKGPWVDYWRQVKGVNDSARVEALLRPTVRYFNEAPGQDSVGRTPYVLVGDKLKGFGQSRLSGSGKVTIDRDSLHGDGDSLAFARGAVSITQLIGTPARLRRDGADSFVVLGAELRLRSEHDTARELRAFEKAQVIRGATVITGDTIVMTFANQKLGLTLAWGRAKGATLESAGYDVLGDSLAVETPAEQLREIRVFHRGMIRNPLDTAAMRLARAPGDTTPPDSTRNTMWGDRIVARFIQVDSAGTVVTRLNGLQAFGVAAAPARSLFARTTIGNDGKASPSINYTLADTIFVTMRTGDSVGIADVRALGHVSGVELETASMAKAKSDSATAAARGRGKP